MTELFIESSEPDLSELSFAEHIELFTPGEYAFEGKTVDHLFFFGDGELITDLPCPPAISQPEPDEELTLGSDEITWSHIEGVSDPDLDICSGDDVELVSFHVVVEYEYENAGEDNRPCSPLRASRPQTHAGALL